ncbi:MAG: DUF4080 domain-containing protein [Ruminococcaceae bacterium]|nr:DUF4080 domain-containing protein [Oscillospiraceae bacterium]
MKILLCAINSKYIHSSLAPWYIKSAIDQLELDNTECRILECTINEGFDKILEKISSYDYDLIGFSTYIWNVNLVLQLAKEIKKSKNKKVLLGGPEVSYNLEEIFLKYDFIDYIVSGEGEEPFADFVSGKNVEEIDGFSYRNGKDFVIKPTHVSKKDPPFPYTQEYLDALNGRITYLETSRGCPFRCAFCLSGRCGGVRFFNLEESKRKILLLANSGTQTVKFIDRTFNADKKRAIEIFNFIIDNYGINIPPSVCFHFEIEGNLVDENMLDLLKKAPKGLFQFEIGLQSFNEETLNHINRKTNLEKLSNVIKEIISLENIHVHIDLIAGMTYETLESFKKGFNRAVKLRPHMLQLGFLKLLHGADMRENPDGFACEYSKEPPYEVISTEWMSKNDLEKLHIFEDCFEKIYNSSRFPLTCEYIFSKAGNVFDALMKFALFCSDNMVENKLDNFTEAILDYFGSQLYINRRELRDYLALDRLSTNKMGTLPECLKIHSALIKKMLNELEKNPQTRKKKGIKRAATILPSMNEFVYVDYNDLDRVKKAYKINRIFINIDEKL